MKFNYLEETVSLFLNLEKLLQSLFSATTRIVRCFAHKIFQSIRFFNHPEILKIKIGRIFRTARNEKPFVRRGWRFSTKLVRLNLEDRRTHPSIALWRIHCWDESAHLSRSKYPFPLSYMTFTTSLLARSPLFLLSLPLPSRNGFRFQP